MPDSPAITLAAVAAAVHHHLPGRDVVDVEDRGVWIRRTFRVTLDGGDVVYVKIDADFGASVKEAFIAGLLHDHGLPAPEVLALDETGTWLPTPFVIQARVGGTRLGELLKQYPDAPTRRAIYAALGDCYRRLHAIRRDAPGWIDGPGVVYPMSPNVHQFEAVIVEIGAQAVAQGHLSPEAHQRLQALWRDQMDYLEDYVPALSGGVLHWTVYLAAEGGWHVTKIMDLHDLCYWDPAWDLAGLRYPAFMPPPDPEMWDAFVAAYGTDPDDRRLKLYLLMQRLDAAMGNYMAPPTPEAARWQAEVWATYEALLDEAASLALC